MAKKKVLFVCAHNFFRSQVAAGIAGAYFPNLSVQSAGVKVTNKYIDRKMGDAPAKWVIQAINERGGNIKGFTPRQMTQADYDWADAIFCFTDKNKGEIDANFGMTDQAAGTDSKVRLLASLAGVDNADIFDLGDETRKTVETISNFILVCLMAGREELSSW